MRNMAKYILDKGEENFPTFTSEEALKICEEEIKKALESIPENAVELVEEARKGKMGKNGGRLEKITGAISYHRAKVDAMNRVRTGLLLQGQRGFLKKKWGQV